MSSEDRTDGPTSPTSAMIEAVKHLSVKMEQDRQQFEKLIEIAKEQSKYSKQNFNFDDSRLRSNGMSIYPSSEDSKQSSQSSQSSLSNDQLNNEGINQTQDLDLNEDFIDKFYQSPSNDEELTIGLISHDKMKPLLIEFCEKYKDILSNYRLIATGTTGTKISNKTGLIIDKKNSGPKGGDIEIANEIVNKGNKKIIAIIFLVDPMWSAPHVNDIHALSRLCNLYNIPYATNIATAQILIRDIKYSNSR